MTNTWIGSFSMCHRIESELNLAFIVTLNIQLQKRPQRYDITQLQFDILRGNEKFSGRSLCITYGESLQAQQQAGRHVTWDFYHISPVVLSLVIQPQLCGNGTILAAPFAGYSNWIYLMPLLFCLYITFATTGIIYMVFCVTCNISSLKAIIEEAFFTISSDGH
jgi:hypothetical protein